MLRTTVGLRRAKSSQKRVRKRHYVRTVRSLYLEQIKLTLLAPTEPSNSSTTQKRRTYRTLRSTSYRNYGVCFFLFSSVTICTLNTTFLLLPDTHRDRSPTRLRSRAQILFLDDLQLKTAYAIIAIVTNNRTTVSKDIQTLETCV